MHTFLPTTLADQLPSTLQATLFIAIFIGLGFWLLGRRLARTTCAMMGMLAGLATGLAIASTMRDGQMATLVITFCALGGMVLAWLLYRIWMSLSLATALALAGPIALLAWQGAMGQMPLQPSTPAQTQSQTSIHHDDSSLRKAISPMTRIIDDEIKKIAAPHAQSASLSLGSLELDASHHAGIEFHPAATSQLFVSAHPDALNHKIFQSMSAYFHSAWSGFEKLTPGQEQLVLLLAGCGAVIGLLAGLMFPTLAASMVSALLGSLLMVLAGRQLLASYLPAAMGQIAGPRFMLVTVSLITMLGIYIQWTMSRRPTDK